MSNPTLEAALAYSGLGFSVLPLAPGEKRPHPRLVPHGLKDATLDPATLEAWWRAEPRAGVGVLPPAQVLVLDLDRPDLLPGLLREYRELEEAPRQRTPKGGAHIFFRLPPGLEGALSATTRALPGLDVRGVGRAYLVAAPTRLEDGRTYTWEVPLRRPEGLPLVPEGLLLRLLPPPPPPPPREAFQGASPRRLQALLGAYAEAVARAVPGTRHNSLVGYGRAAGGLIPHGLDPVEAEEVLVAAAMQAGLPEREARAAVRWGLEVGARVPLPLDPPGFSARGGVFRKGLAENILPSSSQKSVFRKTAIHTSPLRKRRGVL